MGNTSQRSTIPDCYRTRENPAFPESITMPNAPEASEALRGTAGQTALTTRVLSMKDCRYKERRDFQCLM